jgi:hypothetical protein
MEPAVDHAVGSSDPGQFSGARVRWTYPIQEGADVDNDIDGSLEISALIGDPGPSAKTISIAVGEAKEN